MFAETVSSIAWLDEIPPTSVDVSACGHCCFLSWCFRLRLRRLLGYTRRQMYLLTHPLAEFSVAGIFSIPDSRRLSGLREGGGLVDCGWHDRLYWRLYFDCTTAFHIQASVHRLSTVSGDSILYVRL